jgi:hypothetical protein
MERLIPQRTPKDPHDSIKRSECSSTNVCSFQNILKVYTMGPAPVKRPESTAFLYLSFRLLHAGFPIICGEDGAAQTVRRIVAIAQGGGGQPAGIVMGTRRVEAAQETGRTEMEAERWYADLLF